MVANLYYDGNLCIFEPSASEKPIEDEVFALLDLNVTNEAEILDFLHEYHRRYTHGAKTILPGVELSSLDTAAIDSLGLRASQVGGNVSISFDWFDAEGCAREEPALVSVGKFELSNAREAAELLRLVSYLLLYGEGKISSKRFKERCRDNGIDYRVDRCDGSTTFSVNVPLRYFASRDENTSDLLSFQGDRAIVEADELLMHDLGLLKYPTGDELARLGATVLVEKLANERSVKPFWIDPLLQRIRRRESASLIAAVVDMCLAERIAPCPVCGRIVARPKDSSSRFNCGVAGHQQRYNDMAKARVFKGDSAQEVIKKFPYLSEKTIRNWYH